MTFNYLIIKGGFMKRKVIQVAESTQLVSLPRKWALSHNLKKGDEVEVLEEPDRIVIFAEPATDLQARATVDIRGMGRSAYTLLASLYKGGYDEFKVYFSNAEELFIIQKIVKNSCLGFEIVEQSKEYVVARKVSEPIPDEFDSILRRTFVFLQNVAQESYDAISVNDFDAMNQVIAIDASINKFTYFCRRVLNKHGRGPYNITSPLYYMVEQIEEIADRYKHICQMRQTQKRKLSPKALEFYAQVNKLIVQVIALFYKFDWQKLNELHDLHHEIQDMIPEILSSVQKHEFPVIFDLMSIAESVASLSGPVVLIRYDPKLSNAAS